MLSRFDPAIAGDGLLVDLGSHCVDLLDFFLGPITDVAGFPNPPHVHQPLIQTIVDELARVGRCPSTAESGARASWVLNRCLIGAIPSA